MKKAWMSLALGLLLLLPTAVPILAQDEQPPEVVIVHTVGQDKENGFDMTIFLTVRDEAGRPVPSSKISKANISVNGSPDQDADLRDPETPIKIALILDASGSMQNVIGTVRQSAIEAVDRAPTGAEIGVWIFSDLNSDGTYTPGQDFTLNRSLVKDFILQQYNPQSLAPTCMFTAAYKVTEFLQTRLSPADRRAIILFTDGKDERAGGGACSDRSLSDVVSIASASGQTLTPIYTLGLCDNLNCTNIDRDILDRIAVQTHGLEVDGTLDVLTDGFFQIMDDIKSQKVIQAFITPCNQSQGTLALKVLPDIDIAGVFPISSDKCYSPKATTKIDNPRPTSREYEFNLSVTNDSPVLLKQIDMNVLAPDNTLAFTSTFAQQIESRASATVPISIPFLQLTKSGKYTVLLKGVSEDDVFFQSSDKDQNKDVIATTEFEHQALDSVSLEIVSAPVVDYEEGLLRVDELRVTDESEQLKGNEKFLKYQIFLLEGDVRVFESKEYDFDLKEPKIAVPLGDISGDVLPQETPKSYGLQIRLISPGNEPVLSEPFSFIFAPRKEPGFFSRYGLLILGILLAIALAAFLWRWLRTRPFKRKSIPPPQPYTAPTGMLVDRRASPAVAASAAPPPPAPKLHVRVISTPEASQKRDQVAEKFPFVIGRAESDFNISGDKLLSRAHATIDYGPGGFTITDNSRNGVFMNDRRLTPNTPQPLTGRAVIRLGQWTHLEIEPA